MPSNGVPDDFEEWMRDVERRLAQLERLPLGRRATPAVPASGSTPSSGGDITLPDSSSEDPSTTAGP